ncbi:MAG: response regulator [Rhizobiaceae bacterium]|nr:response regulator [Rhizobiaceae bacterium]
MNILIVEDDQQLAEQLVASLNENGHQTVHVSDGEAGEQQATQMAYDVMIVDRMLPKQDGLTMISNLRQAGMKTPVLILSALGQVDDRVTGLRAGGDDYLSKPYAFSELLARVEILGRRAESQSTDTTVTVADLSLDRIGHSAERAGQKITLQPREYRLLEYLMRNEGRLVTRTMLLEHVWDLHFDPQTNVIDVHISRLRAKIDKDFDTALLQTVRGRGYRLAQPDDVSE